MSMFEYIALAVIMILALFLVVHMIMRIAKGKSSCLFCKGGDDKEKSSCCVPNEGGDKQEDETKED